jgi:hypothetical protein
LPQSWRTPGSVSSCKAQYYLVVFFLSGFSESKPEIVLTASPSHIICRTVPNLRVPSQQGRWGGYIIHERSRQRTLALRPTWHHRSDTRACLHIVPRRRSDGPPHFAPPSSTPNCHRSLAMQLETPCETSSMVISLDSQSPADVPVSKYPQDTPTHIACVISPPHDIEDNQSTG